MSFNGLVKKPAQSVAAIIALVMVLCVYSVGTISRNIVWRNDFILFMDTISKSPDAWILRLDLARAYYSKGMIDKGLEQEMTALKLSFKGSGTQNNAAASACMGSADTAIINAQAIALKLKQDYAKTHYKLGNSLAVEGKLDEAIKEYNEALKISPDDVTSHYNLGLTLVRKGLLNEAIKELEIARRLKPGDPDIHNNLGIAYAETNNADKALEEFQCALRLNPNDKNIQKNLVRQRGY